MHVSKATAQKKAVSVIDALIFSLQYIISYSECVTHYSLIQKMYTITKACNEECVGQISSVF